MENIRVVVNNEALICLSDNSFILPTHKKIINTTTYRNQNKYYLVTKIF